MTGNGGFEADYVVVGGGAVGMSFVDVILAESDATVIMVDRRAHPGGHWNDAYSFVRLHQPSGFYGVNSTELGRGRKDERGPNAGLYELATGDEIRAYFDQVLRDKFLPSGRFTYFPMSEYTEDGRVTSLLTGAQLAVRAHRKVVDAGYIGSDVPSTQSPAYPAAPGVELVPVNDLARIDRRRAAYVIVGSGKTGADACLWLLGLGVDPSAIVWIRPRDSWFFNRASFQGSFQTLGSFATQLEVVAQATSMEDILQGFEATGQMLRIDRDHWPTMFRAATTTVAEVELLRTITNVIRLGHVIRIERGALVMEHGTVPTEDDCLYVDCTARGIPNRSPVPIFDEKMITLQYVIYGGLPTYSAAIAAFIELVCDGDDRKNAICPPLPITGELTDIPRNLMTDLRVREEWFGDNRIREWMDKARLNPTAGAASVESGDAEKQALVGRLLTTMGPARSNLERIVAHAASPSAGSEPEAISTDR
jgi:hypothetical protein